MPNAALSAATCQAMERFYHRMAAAVPPDCPEHTKYLMHARNWAIRALGLDIPKEKEESWTSKL